MRVIFIRTVDLFLGMTTNELEAYGMESMDDEGIEQLLSTQRVGILGVPSDDAPVLRPLSFWFDGSSSLYFVYVLGPESRKVTWSDRAIVARFLVYSIETTFNWRSVLLTGTIDEVPEHEQDRIRAELDLAWQPDLFERASQSADTTLYRFHIEDRAGIKQVGLPPGLEAGTGDGPGQ